LVGSSSYGKEAPLNTSSFFVDADEYNSHADQTSDLLGHVRVIHGTEQMTCDKAHIDLNKNAILAEGNVVFITPTSFVRAEKMDYNFQTKKGIIENGFLQSGHETIEGEEIIKIGETEYQAKNATYTSCVNCPASWKFSGSKIDAAVGDYAYVSNAVVRIYGAPVLWLPYAIIPIKTQRQSGLLPPSFGFGSSDGFKIGDSYFWNINKSKDATITETNYASRGLKTGVEYRFVADENSHGKFLGNFINDAGYAGDSRFTSPDCRYSFQGCPSTASTARTSGPIPRYALHYEQHYELPDNYVNNIDLNLVRDTNYNLDFPQEMIGQGDPALENRFSLAKNTENTHTSADIDIYENLLKADPMGQNSDAVHRAPELKYSLMPTKLWGIRTALDVDYVNFFRPGTTYDDPHNIAPTFSNPSNLLNGGYADKFRTGQRVIVKPDFTYPFNVGDFLDMLPQLTYEEDYYQFGYSPPAISGTPPVLPTASRRSVRTSLTTKTRLSSVFTLGSDPSTNKFKHEFIPEVKYTYVPYLYQDQHAFFLGNLVNTYGRTYVPQAYDNQPVTEFDNLQFDYRDRLRDLNLVTFGLTNVLIQKRLDGKNNSYSQIIRHRLTQSYDFYAAQQPDFTPTGTRLVKQPWSEIHSLLEAKFSYFNFNSDLSYFGYDQIAAETTSLGVHNNKGDAISVGYSETYTAKIDPLSGLIVDQVDLSTHAQAVNLTVFLTTNFLDISSSVGYDLIYKNFTSYLVNGLLKLPGKCWGIAFTLQQTLGGSGNTSFSLPIFFGDTPNSLPRPPGV